MAYTDAQNRFSENQSLVGSGTIVSTNWIDLLTPNKNIGMSGRGRIVATMTATLTGATAVQAQVVESANANMSSPTVIASGPTVAVADAVAGGKPILDIALPNSTKRYIGLQYVLTGTATAGTVWAGVTETIDHNPYLPANLGR